MRVAMVAYAYYEGNSRIQQYAKALTERGDTVDIICQGKTIQPAGGCFGRGTLYGIHSRPKGPESKVVYITDSIKFMFQSASLLTELHFKNRYDVVHVHSVPDCLVFTAIIPKLTGTRILLDIHDILPEFYASKFGASSGSIMFKLLVLVEKLSIAFSDHVIIANPIWKKRLIGRSVSPDKVTTIGNHPSADIFSWRPRQRNDGKFIMMYPGSLNWHQGLDIAVRAFAMVAPFAPNAEFHIYGDGPERKNLVKLAHELGVDEKIKFGEFMSTKEIVEVMTEADLAVVPKRSKSVFGTEAASTKILEFMSLGVPAVISKTKIDSLYHNESRVKFFEHDDPDELAKAILEFYGNPKLREMLAKNALEYAREQSWDNRKNDYLAVIDSITAGESRMYLSQREVPSRQ
jgi:glycosyltransferase involved in cell wall biosynthesis